MISEQDAKPTKRTKKEPPPVSAKTIEKIGGPKADIVTLQSQLLTHAPKVPTALVRSEPILDVASIKQDPFLKVGICSPALRSNSPIGLGYTGVDIGLSQELSSEIAAKTTAETKPSPLMLALQGDVAGLLALGFDQARAQILVQLVQNLQDSAPDTVHHLLKQVYVEGQGDTVLCTPVYPIKFAQELNKRTRIRWETVQEFHAKNQTPTTDEGATTDESADFEEGSSEEESSEEVPQKEGPLRPPGCVLLPVGGAQPQNASYLVLKRAPTLSRGGVPALILCSPSAKGTPTQRMLRLLRASGQYSRVADLNKQSLALYGYRAKLGLDLASHRNAEQAHAQDLAEAFLRPAAHLRVVFASLPRALWESGGWAEVDENVQRLLDPRLGAFDAGTLADKFAHNVAALVARNLPKEQTGGAPFIMPDRSFDALRGAFQTQLKALSHASQDKEGTV